MHMLLSLVSLSWLTNHSQIYVHSFTMLVNLFIRTVEYCSSTVVCLTCSWVDRVDVVIILNLLSWWVEINGWGPKCSIFNIIDISVLPFFGKLLVMLANPFLKFILLQAFLFVYSSLRLFSLYFVLKIMEEVVDFGFPFVMFLLNHLFILGQLQVLFPSHDNLLLTALC